MSRPKPSRAELLDQCRRRYRSGRYLPELARDDAHRVLVVALDHSDRGLEELVEQVIEHQVAQPNLKPLFLVGPVRTNALSRYALQFETILDEQGWVALSIGGSYGRYRQRRVRETAELYDVATVVIANEDGPLPDWALP